MDQELICAIADEIIRQLTASGQLCPAPRPQEDPASPEDKASALLDSVSDPDALARTIHNMASSITGMICDGGNQGCVMKGVTAVDAAFRAAAFARSGVAIDPVHGINAPDPETTMRYMGRIASPGMVGTEKTIVEIFEEKMG